MIKNKEKHSFSWRGKTVLASLLGLFFAVFIATTHPKALAETFPDVFSYYQDGELPLSSLSNIKDSASEFQLDERDGIVLATIAYLNFEETPVDGLDENKSVSLSQALENADTEKLIAGSWLYDFSGTAFVDNLRENPRYGNLKIENYINTVSVEDTCQFSAITYLLPDNSIFVAFRGTDNSITAWKEDANASYMKELPAQEKALAYLEAEAALHPTSKIYVGGHSKGGSLAEYAVSLCGENTFSHVVSIRSYDGIGFMTGLPGRMNTEGYRAKLVKYCPEDSIFGRLFENRDDIKMVIVSSDGEQFSQHATTNWMVKDGQVVEKESFTRFSNIVKTSMDTWVNSYNDAEKQQLIDTVFEVVYESDFENWTDFKNDPAEMSRQLASRTAELDPETRDAVFKAIGRLLQILEVETISQSLPF